MDRADGKGLGLAIAAHALLFAALTIGIAHRAPPKSVQQPAVDVQLVDAVGLQAAAPSPATEAPQEQTAPEQAPPEESAAPPPALQPKPVAEKTPPPTSAPAPTPAKPQPAKAAPAKSELKLSSSLLSDLKATAQAEGKASRSAGSRLGPDFLKGIANPSAGKAAAPRAQISGAAMNSLGAAILRQIRPCVDFGALGGTPAMRITTLLDLRFNADGSVAGTPQLVEQNGVGDDNRSYAKQMADVSRRAVLRCAPLKLPAELYAGGWEHLQLNFIPGQLQ